MLPRWSFADIINFYFLFSCGKWIFYSFVGRFFFSVLLSPKTRLRDLVVIPIHHLLIIYFFFFLRSTFVFEDWWPVCYNNWKSYSCKRVYVNFLSRTFFYVGYQYNMQFSSIIHSTKINLDFGYQRQTILFKIIHKRVEGWEKNSRAQYVCRYHRESKTDGSRR